MTVRAIIVSLAALGLAGAMIACSQSRPEPRPARITAAAAFVWKLPPGIPTPNVPADNPMLAAKVALGRRLFYDTRLSGNHTFSCASCHQQARAFTDGRAHALGSTGASHARSAMSLTNVAFNTSYGWAGPTDRSLEAQMAVPMFNEHPIELGLKGREREIEARFTKDEDVQQFKDAFPDDPAPVTLSNIVKAIAAFERTLISGNSPLDRYLYRDDRTALSAPARRGMDLFFSPRLRCSECHEGFNLSGDVTFQGGKPPTLTFHNTGLYNVDGKGAYPASDRGLVDITKRPSDMGRFRAPTLRNIALTAPYMHDGSLATLDDVLTHYRSGGVTSPVKSNRIRAFRLSGTERKDLMAFLESLTDQTFVTNPDFGPPQ